MGKNKTSCRLLAFTTVELLTVMGILGVLMALGIGIFALASGKMSETRTRGTIAKLEVALENYKAKFGYYPQQPSYGYFKLDEIDSDADVDTAEHPKSNFCQFIDYENMKSSDCEQDTSDPKVYYVLDGYGAKIFYRCPGLYNKETFDLVSLGSDAKAGESTADIDDETDANTHKDELGKVDDIANFRR